MRRSSRLMVTIVAALALLGVAGCSGDGGGDGPGPKIGKSAGIKKGFSVEAALNDLPALKADGNQVVVSTADLAEATKLGDLPDPNADLKDSAWLVGLNRPPLFVPTSNGLGVQRALTGAMRETLGFDVRNVDRFTAVEAQPQEITVMKLADGVELKDGVTATGKGEPGQIDTNVDNTAGAFPVILGVAEKNGLVALSKPADVLKAWTDESGDTMADDEAFSSIAKALDGHDVYAAMLVGGPSNSPNLSPAQQEKLDPSMPDFDAVGIGQGVTDGKAVEYVAYRVDDAEEAADAIEKTWTDGVSLLDGRPVSDLVKVADVSAKDGVVVVEIAPVQNPGIAVQMLIGGDTPFVVR